ncbi:unnamed protein product [Amoebophrya sp. A120]|nr:unnamed protein product [Amoebophrya sp. A120]|eukprot:GSA120T00004337001.1
MINIVLTTTPASSEDFIWAGLLVSSKVKQSLLGACQWSLQHGLLAFLS